MKKFYLFAAAVLLVATVSCNKGRIEMKTDSASIHKGETVLIDASSKQAINYSSQNKYHATVSQKGLVLANYVGSTTIKLETKNDSEDFTINVVPRWNLYTEPEFKFGITESDAKSKYGEPDYIDDDCFTYITNNEKAPYLMILFDNGKLEAYVFIINKSSGTELGNFIDERYNYYDQFDGIRAHINDLDIMDATMAIYYYFNTEIQMYLSYYFDFKVRHNSEDVATKVSKALSKIGVFQF